MRVVDAMENMSENSFLKSKAKLDKKEKELSSNGCLLQIRSIKGAFLEVKYPTASLPQCSQYNYQQLYRIIPWLARRILHSNAVVAEFLLAFVQAIVLKGWRTDPEKLPPRSTYMVDDTDDADQPNRIIRAEPNNGPDPDPSTIEFRTVAILNPHGIQTLEFILTPLISLASNSKQPLTSKNEEDIDEVILDLEMMYYECNEMYKNTSGLFEWMQSSSNNGEIQKGVLAVRKEMCSLMRAIQEKTPKRNNSVIPKKHCKSDKMGIQEQRRAQEHKALKASK
ncbi:hypothetical protein B7494_g4625 [Chlorociboria aeruginascens]|nr:hypothetical protein B7494_g4625 [Chlorociboria aeruginascens]